MILVWLFVIAFVCSIVVLLLISSLEKDQEKRRGKFENVREEKEILALDAYIDYLLRTKTSDKVADMTSNEIRYYLSMKLETYKNVLSEVRQINVPWWGGIFHVRGVDKKRAEKRAELVSLIENDGFDLMRIEEILEERCSPVEPTGFILRN